MPQAAAPGTQVTPADELRTTAGDELISPESPGVQTSTTDPLIPDPLTTGPDPLTTGPDPESTDPPTAALPPMSEVW